MDRNLFNTAPKTSSFAYNAMVIRYWQEHHPIKGAYWRCSLVNPNTGKQMGFKSFADLSAYLAATFEGEG